MNLLKELKKLSVQHILLLSGTILVVLYLTNYSSQLGSLFSGMNNQNSSSNDDENENENVNENENQVLSQVNAAAPAGMNSGPSSVNGLQNVTGAASLNNSNQAASNPADLLPKDNNNQWGNLNPNGAGELSNLNLLNAGHLAGVVGPVNKNSNLTIRAEPPNPRGNTGPWNSSTIETDTMRRGLDVC